MCLSGIEYLSMFCRFVMFDSLIWYSDEEKKLGLIEENRRRKEEGRNEKRERGQH